MRKLLRDIADLDPQACNNKLASDLGLPFLIFRLIHRQRVRNGGAP